jgi:hypothetical protein
MMIWSCRKFGINSNPKLTLKGEINEGAFSNPPLSDVLTSQSNTL